MIALKHCMVQRLAAMSPEERLGMLPGLRSLACADDFVAWVVDTIIEPGRVEELAGLHVPSVPEPIELHHRLREELNSMISDEAREVLGCYDILGYWLPVVYRPRWRMDEAKEQLEEEAEKARGIIEEHVRDARAQVNEIINAAWPEKAAR